jgi:hypothetical protein
MAPAAIVESFAAAAGWAFAVATVLNFGGAGWSVSSLWETDYVSTQRWTEYSALAGFATAAIACLLSWGHVLPWRLPSFMAAATAFAPPRRAALPTVVVTAEAPLDARPFASDAENGYYERLRKRLRWVQTRVGHAVMLTPDLRSRMLLAKSAARRAHLGEVGLSFMDVYGIINAETSWVPRPGASKDGTPNLGIAQFEPATARALGIDDPNDPVEAVHAAAVNMKQAAIWSASRLRGLKLTAAERAEKLREGVSIYYNLSSRGRALWNGRNTDRLPRETQLHILNARVGAREAALLEAQLRANRFRADHPEAVVTAGDPASGG